MFEKMFHELRRIFGLLFAFHTKMCADYMELTYKTVKKVSANVIVRNQ